MKRVLIVSPHFVPVNAPDMQRVRVALGPLRELGWEPTVLAVDPCSVEGGVMEPELADTFPRDIEVVRVTGVSARVTRPFGIGSLWWRCGRALRLAGDRLLAQRRFDAVLFSTTQFDAFQLGPRWHRRYGVPYVIDLQDPWVNPYYRRQHVRPPGGWLKFEVGQWLARRREPRVMHDAAAIAVVSPDYRQDLLNRYPRLAPDSVVTIPFGASPLDLDAARQRIPARPLIRPDSDCIDHVYTGRCGPDMEAPLRSLFGAFQQYLTIAPDEAQRIRFHFIGTSYASADRAQESVTPIAREAGVHDYVQEYRQRVPYLEALHYVAQARATVILGSDDPGYAASKLYPYVLAQRPTLLIAHERSPMLAFAEQSHFAIACPFGSPGDPASAATVLDRWFLPRGWERPPRTPEAVIRSVQADTMTRLLAQVLDRAARSHQ